MALTPRQQRFVDEYLIDLNGARAAIRCGYSARAAKEQASRLLTNANVALAVQAGMDARAERAHIRADDVLREVAMLAYADLGEVLDVGSSPGWFRLKPGRDIPPEARRAIAAIKVRRRLVGSGDNAHEVEVTEFKLWPKVEALKLLMLHLGMLTERHEHTFPQGIPVGVEDAEAGRRRLEEYRRQRSHEHTNGTAS